MPDQDARARLLQALELVQHADPQIFFIPAMEVRHSVPRRGEGWLQLESPAEMTHGALLVIPVRQDRADIIVPVRIIRIDLDHLPEELERLVSSLQVFVLDAKDQQRMTIVSIQLKHLFHMGYALCLILEIEPGDAAIGPGCLPAGKALTEPGEDLVGTRIIVLLQHTYSPAHQAETFGWFYSRTRIAAGYSRKNEKEGRYPDKTNRCVQISIPSRKTLPTFTLDSTIPKSLLKHDLFRFRGLDYTACILPPAGFSVGEQFVNMRPF